MKPNKVATLRLQHLIPGIVQALGVDVAVLHNDEDSTILVEVFLWTNDVIDGK